MIYPEDRNYRQSAERPWVELSDVVSKLHHESSLSILQPPLMHQVLLRSVSARDKLF